jgi:hypothetical protein
VCGFLHGLFVVGVEGVEVALDVLPADDELAGTVEACLDSAERAERKLTPEGTYNKYSAISQHCGCPAAQDVTQIGNSLRLFP